MKAEGCANDLLSRARSGDATAFTALVRAHQRTVFSLALRMVSDRHEAEDLAQDVFLRLHHDLHGLESDLHLKAWLRRVTVHRAIDWIRQRPARHAEPLEMATALTGETNDDDPLLQNRIRELLAELAPVPRAIVLLRYQEDMDPTEIARTLHMSLFTVKSHLKRSLKRLRERASELAVP